MTRKQVFDEEGLLHCRGLIDKDTLALWRAAWEDFYQADRTVEWNPVAVNGPFPQELAMMPAYPPILDVVQELFGEDIALYNHRFVVKDSNARERVFLHQDTAYHFGGFQKASAFVALTDMEEANGGLIFHKGTHKLGYLSDAGELSHFMHPRFECVSPSVKAGDVVFMHSALWHESHPNPHGMMRVLADIHYCPADDAGAIALLRGKWQTPYHLTRKQKENMFVRSRVSRIRALEAEVKTLKGDK